MNSGPGEKFELIRDLRNSIVHFSSSHETFQHHSVSIHGLADTTRYDALSYESAKDALDAAEGILTEVFRLDNNIESERLPDLLHAWAGKISTR